MKSVFLICVLLLAKEQFTAAATFDFDKDEIQVVMRKTMLESEGNVMDVKRFSVDGFLEGNGTNLKSCSCQKTMCGCCFHMEIESINLNDTVCFNASYLPKEIGVEVALVLDGKVLFSEKVSAKNPPPICADIPDLKKLASLCLRLYNLGYASNYFSGCAEVEARLAGIKLGKVSLGCFKFPIASGVDKID